MLMLQVRSWGPCQGFSLCPLLGRTTLTAPKSTILLMLQNRSLALLGLVHPHLHPLGSEEGQICSASWARLAEELTPGICSWSQSWWRLREVFCTPSPGTFPLGGEYLLSPKRRYANHILRRSEASRPPGVPGIQDMHKSWVGGTN